MISTGRWVVAGLLGGVAPMLYQCLTGRLRAALALGALAHVCIGVLVLWPALLPLAALLLLASAVDAARACRRGARAQRRYLPVAALALLLLGGSDWLQREFVHQSFRAPSTSMLPALTLGDHFLVDKLSLRWRSPARGEIIVFRHPGTGHFFMKRVIGVAGDAVAMQGQRPVLQGAAVPHRALAPSSVQDPFEMNVAVYEESLGGRRYRIFDHPGGTSTRSYPGTGAEVPCPNADDGEPSPYDAPPPADAPIQPPMQATMDGAACVVPPGAVFVLGDSRWNSNDSRRWGAVPLAAVVGRVRGIWWPARSLVRGDPRWARLGWVE